MDPPSTVHSFHLLTHQFNMVRARDIAKPRKGNSQRCNVYDLSSRTGKQAIDPQGCGIAVADGRHPDGAAATTQPHPQKTPEDMQHEIQMLLQRNAMLTQQNQGFQAKLRSLGVPLGAEPHSHKVISRSTDARDQVSTGKRHAGSETVVPGAGGKRHKTDHLDRRLGDEKRAVLAQGMVDWGSGSSLNFVSI